MKVLKLLKTAFGINLLKNPKKHRQFSRVHETNIIEKQRFCCGWLAAGDVWPEYNPNVSPKFLQYNEFPAFVCVEARKET